MSALWEKLQRLSRDPGATAAERQRALELLQRRFASGAPAPDVAAEVEKAWLRPGRRGLRVATEEGFLRVVAVQPWARANLTGRRIVKAGGFTEAPLVKVALPGSPWRLRYFAVAFVMTLLPLLLLFWLVIS